MTKRGYVNYKKYSGEDTKYDWNTKTIADLTAKPEYMGHTVNFRTNKKSYKDRRRTKLPQGEWKIFENTHFAIINEETWNLAQNCRETKRRPNYLGEANPLTGLMYCADCGNKMYNHREAATGKMYYHKQLGKSYPRSARDVYYCSAYSNKAISLRVRPCKPHFIRTAVVRELLLDTIKNVSGYVRGNETEFVKQVRKASEIQQESLAKLSSKQLVKNQKRRAELDTIISKLYEDNATGKILDARFEILLAGYENEQSELAQAVAKLQTELASFDSDSVRADKFIEVVKKFTDFSELTTPMINEFVEKIIVHEADKSDDGRFQKVDIYLNFIGKFDVPIPEPTPKEIAEMEKLQTRRKKKREAFHRYVEKRRREMEQANLD